MHEVVREFGRRRCLAGSVHADDQNHGRFAGRSTNWRRIARQNARDLFAHRFDYVADSEQGPRLAFLERLDDSQCHRDAEIGADERFFELIPIDRLACELVCERLKKIS